MKLEKITPSTPRWYDDACGTAHALELVGERWSLLIVRELLLGPRRFGDLRASLNGISANVLTQRLEGLETAGIVKKQKLPPPASVQVYGLTPWGLEAEEAIKTLGRWAARSPDHDPTLSLSAVSLMMSMRTMFDASAAEQMDVSLEFQLEEGVFWARAHGAEFGNGRGHAERPDAILTGRPEPIAGIIYDDIDPQAMMAEGAVGITGDLEAVRRFGRFFTLPPKAERG